ncbi:MAG TPA: hypothetical protein V6C72_18870, partial [Chroococcales cyanobacterium]
MQTTEPTLAEQVIQLKLDAESKRILDQIEPSNRDAYINEAIKSFQKSQSGKGATNAAPQSAAADLTNLTNAGQARAHFERIFGNDFAFVD